MALSLLLDDGDLARETKAKAPSVKRSEKGHGDENEDKNNIQIPGPARIITKTKAATTLPLLRFCLSLACRANFASMRSLKGN